MNQIKRQIIIGNILAIIGGLLLFSGDMLLYYNGRHTNRLQNMAVSADWRIISSGVLALLATWFYLFGLIPVYYAFKPAKPWIRHTVVLLFAAILIAYGVVHGVYTAIATSAKIAYQNHLDITESCRLAIKVNQTVRLFVYPLFALLSGLFIYQVWTQKTLYPKWMVFFFPLLPFLLRKPIRNLLQGAALTIISGGYLNLILIVFFMASLIALKNYNTR